MGAYKKRILDNWGLREDSDRICGFISCFWKRNYSQIYGQGTESGNGIFLSLTKSMNVNVDILLWYFLKEQCLRKKTDLQYYYIPFKLLIYTFNYWHINTNLGAISSKSVILTNSIFLFVKVVNNKSLNDYIEFENPSRLSPINVRKWIC